MQGTGHIRLAIPPMTMKTKKEPSPVYKNAIAIETLLGRSNTKNDENVLQKGTTTFYSEHHAPAVACWKDLRKEKRSQMIHQEKKIGKGLVVSCGDGGGGNSNRLVSPFTQMLERKGPDGHDNNK